jgi:metal-dependent amidase/aminoacylase/carboxypeptidase family protein
VQIIVGTAQLHGCTAEVEWSAQAYGPTVNDPELVSLVEGAAKKLAGAPRWQRLAEPTMAAEDFSFLAGVRWLPVRQRYGVCNHRFKSSSEVLSSGAGTKK